MTVFGVLVSAGYLNFGSSAVVHVLPQPKLLSMVCLVLCRTVRWGVLSPCLSLLTPPTAPSLPADAPLGVWRWLPCLPGALLPCGDREILSHTLVLGGAAANPGSRAYQVKPIGFLPKVSTASCSVMGQYRSYINLCRFIHLPYLLIRLRVLVSLDSIPGMTGHQEGDTLDASPHRTLTCTQHIYTLETLVYLSL